MNFLHKRFSPFYHRIIDDLTVWSKELKWVMKVLTSWFVFKDFWWMGVLSFFAFTLALVILLNNGEMEIVYSVNIPRLLWSLCSTKKLTVTCLISEVNCTTTTQTNCKWKWNKCFIKLNWIFLLSHKSCFWFLVI